ncbi:MAG: lysine transporter LysE [Rhodobacterales bacterium]|nr:MAG: lysine transporter LysE [Rhodobacterales bacterium]
MSFDMWASFIAASALLLIIPGPTILLVMSYALSQGRRVAVAMALGVACGDLIAMSASVLGVGALVAASAQAFLLLKYLGAAYLIYLGIRLLRSPPALPGQTRTQTKSRRALFAHAAAVTALNPKSIGFFIAFVPQFITPDQALAPQFALLITSFVTLAALNALAYALLADRLRRGIRKPAVLRWLNRSGGAALIGMGVMAARLQRQNS